MILLLLLCTGSCIGWVPPGMSERQAEHHHSAETVRHGHPVDGQNTENQPLENTDNQHLDNMEHMEHMDHNHNDNDNVEEIISDAEHLVDDMKDIYTSEEIMNMEQEERIFTWFQAHDQDEDGTLDGLELLKAFSHDHNFHHEIEDDSVVEDDANDPAQHTEAADRQRFRRTVKAVDKILDEDDIDNNGQIEYTEFMTAFTDGKLEKVKIKKTS